MCDKKLNFIFLNQNTCGDPESFVREGPNLIKKILVSEGIKDPNVTINGPAKRHITFKWRLAGWPMIAQH